MAQAQIRQDERSPGPGHSSDGTAMARETASPARTLARTAIPLPHDEITAGTTMPAAAQEPVVRRWQELIGASLAAEEQAERDERWSLSQSLPLLALASFGLWGLLIVGVARIL